MHDVRSLSGHLGPYSGIGIVVVSVSVIKLLKKIREVAAIIVRIGVVKGVDSKFITCNDFRADV